MNKNEIVESFKEVLAEAINFGSIGATHGYRGTIDLPENEPLVESMKKLHLKVENLIALLPVSDLDAEEVFPLHSEIVELTEHHE